MAKLSYNDLCAVRGVPRTLKVSLAASFARDARDAAEAEAGRMARKLQGKSRRWRSAVRSSKVDLAAFG